MTTPPAPDEPRVAHYLYAHRALPRTFLRNPAAILGILGSDDAMPFLSGMWDVIDKELAPGHRLDIRGLTHHFYELANDVFASVVTLPPPQRVFEAYFVAMVARLDGEQTFARCLSLDLAGVPGPNALTGILEWDDNGKHELLTEGCQPNRSAFVDAVERLLTETAPSTPNRAD